MDSRNMAGDAQAVHDYRAFVQAEMDARGWSQAELARASGVTPAVISRLLGDDQTRLRKLPADKTITGLANAFGGHRMEARLWSKVAEAMGFTVAVAAPVADAELLSNDELMRELSARLRQDEPRAVTDELSVRRVHIRPTGMADDEQVDAGPRDTRGKRAARDKPKADEPPNPLGGHT